MKNTIKVYKTENANPKPFNISRLKCQCYKLGRTALLGLSINQSKDPSTNWLNRMQIKKLPKCKKVVYRLLFVL